MTCWLLWVCCNASTVSLLLLLSNPPPLCFSQNFCAHIIKCSWTDRAETWIVPEAWWRSNKKAKLEGNQLGKLSEAILEHVCDREINSSCKMMSTTVDPFGLSQRKRDGPFLLGSWGDGEPANSFLLDLSLFATAPQSFACFPHPYPGSQVKEAFYSWPG